MSCPQSEFNQCYRLWVLVSNGLFLKDQIQNLIIIQLILLLIQIFNIKHQVHSYPYWSSFRHRTTFLRDLLKSSPAFWVIFCYKSLCTPPGWAVLKNTKRTWTYGKGWVSRFKSLVVKWRNPAGNRILEQLSLHLSLIKRKQKICTYTTWK